MSSEYHLIGVDRVEAEIDARDLAASTGMSRDAVIAFGHNLRAAITEQKAQATADGAHEQEQGV